MSVEDASPEPALTEVESALGSLVPSRVRFDRDRVLFRLGQASARPPSASSGRRGWMAIAATFALVASGEGVLLARRPQPEVVERVVVVREPAAPPIAPRVDQVAFPGPARRRPPGPSAGLGATAHERLAEQVLRYGLDGLPRPAPVSLSWGAPETRAVSPRRQLQEELRKSLVPGGPT